MRIKRFVLLAAFMEAFSLSAKTLYVNCQMADYSGHDGTTPEKAFETIQEGIGAATEAGDTVLVAPGVYGKGTGAADAGWGPSRIGWSDRGINIIATSSNPADTVILGERSSETPEGYGAGGVRCIAVKGGGGTVVKGFTLRDGHSESAAVKDSTAGRKAACQNGGAVYADSQDVIFADCVLVDCSAQSYGAAYGGTYVRCRIMKCTCKSGGMLFGGTGKDVTKRAKIYCCVFDHNSNAGYSTSGGIMIYNTSAWNCTFANNYTSNRAPIA